MIVGLVVFTQIFASNSPILFSNARYHALPEDFFEFKMGDWGLSTATPEGSRRRRAFARSATLRYDKIAEDFAIYGSAKRVNTIEVLVYLSPNDSPVLLGDKIVENSSKFPVVTGECKILAGSVNGPTVAEGKFQSCETTSKALLFGNNKSHLRPLHQAVFQFKDTKLEPGKYWCSFAFSTEIADIRVYVPYLFMDGGSSFRNANAMLFDVQAKNWKPVFPGERSVEFPFVVRGK